MIMTLAVDDILSALESHALSLGYFDRVNAYEPKGRPGRGLTCAIWTDLVEPAVGASGLASTSSRITFSVRLYTNMLMEPQDAIDPELMKALDALMRAYTGDFTLGGLIRNIELLGGPGAPGMEAQAGYISMDNVMYRVLTIRLPIIVNDLWDQAE